MGIKFLVLFVTLFSFLCINISFAQALPPAPRCTGPNDDATCRAFDPDFTCQYFDTTSGGPLYYCAEESTVSKIFGKIQPPDALKGFVQKDPTGAGGLSIFLSNLVTLIYGIAAVVLIFMIVWGAFDWITAEGDKEKLERARNKIMNAIIGILLFAAAFGIIRVLGQFTGFKFFVGQDQVRTNIPASITNTTNPNPAAGASSRPRPSVDDRLPCQINPRLCRSNQTCTTSAGGSADRNGCVDNVVF